MLAAFQSGVAGGCAPIATPTWDGTYPDICGDAITVTWNVIDICETTQFDATYTVTAPTALTVPAVTPQRLVPVTSVITELPQTKPLLRQH